MRSMASMNDVESPRSAAGPPAGPAPRTFLFALTDGGGTVPPELGVARRLVDRGHRVSVLADTSMAGQVSRTGASFLPCMWSPAEEFRDWDLRTPTSIARGIADYMITGPAPAQASDTAAALDTTPPDLVLTSSFAVGAMIAAEARRFPFDVLLPNAYPLPAKGMPPFGTGLAPARGPLGWLRDRALNAASARLIDRYALAKINVVRAEYGLDPVAHMWDQMHHARRQLILTSPAFDFPSELPGNARYVGPILDDPAWASDESWTLPAGADPLVLVAMSSTFQNHVACLQRIVDALGSLPVRGLVTTGPAVPSQAIKAPPNVTVAASAPHLDAMRHASLVVTHGGHGTVIKALAAGLPLVVLHHGRDQADNAVRVTVRGAGIAVPRRAPVRRIARAVATVLGDGSYRLAAEELGRAVARDAANSTLLFGELES